MPTARRERSTRTTWTTGSKVRRLASRSRMRCARTPITRPGRICPRGATSMSNNAIPRYSAMPARAVVLAMLILSLSAFPAMAADRSAPSPLAFADHLYAQGDYYRAVTEYERVMFLHPGTAMANTARFQIAQCYFQSEKYAQAVERFRARAMDIPADPLGERARYMLAETYYRKGEYQSAIDAGETFLRSYPQSNRRDAMHIRLGWCHLRQGNAARAAEEFRKLPPSSPLAQQGNGLADEALRLSEVPRKSPYLAGAL